MQPAAGRFGCKEISSRLFACLISVPPGRKPVAPFAGDMSISKQDLFRSDRTPFVPKHFPRTAANSESSFNRGQGFFRMHSWFVNVRGFTCTCTCSIGGITGEPTSSGCSFGGVVGPEMQPGISTRQEPTIEVVALGCSFFRAFRDVGRLPVDMMRHDRCLCCQLVYPGLAIHMLDQRSRRPNDPTAG